MTSQNNTTSITSASNNDQTTFDAFSQLGVTLTQRPITSTASRNGAPAERTEGDDVIREAPWTLDHMLARPNFVGSIPWSTTAASHTVLAKYRIPHDLVSVNTLTQTPFNSFTYWNGKIKIMAQVAGSPQTQGCVMMTFIPLSDPQFIDSTLVSNFSALSINDSNYLFSNANTVATSTIDFNSPYSYLNIKEVTPATQTNTLGYLYFTVLNPLLLSTSSSDTVSISLFSIFEQNKFKVPRISGFTSFKRVKPQGKNLPASPGPLQSITKIANSVMPENIIGTALDSVFGALGLDKPINPQYDPPNKVVSTQLMNFCSGEERINKLTIQGCETAHLSEQTFATSVDEMSHDYLYKKLSYLGSFSMRTTDGIGQVLASFPMNPIPTRIQNESESKLPLISYLSIPYQYWRGGLTYHMQVVATSLQTAKIYIAYNYGEYLPQVTPALDMITSQYGMGFEINQGSNQVDFTVPFIAPTHNLHVPNSNQPSIYDTMGMINICVLNPLVATQGAPQEITMNLFIAGAPDFHLDTLTAGKQLYPFNPIKRQEQSKKKIRYVRAESAEEDIEIIEIPTITRINKVKAQGKELEAAQPLITPAIDTDLATANPAGPAETSGEPEKPNAQKIIPGVREPLLKYQMMESIILMNPENVAEADVHVIRISDYFGAYTPDSTAVIPMNQTQLPSRGLFTFYQLLYRQFKGGLNFKIMLPDDRYRINYTFMIFYIPPVYNKVVANTDWRPVLRNQILRTSSDPLSFNDRTSQYQRPDMTRLPIDYVNGINATAEFSVPFSSRLSSILSKSGPNSENELELSELCDLGHIAIYYQTKANRPAVQPYTRAHIFMSLSDEARFGTLFNIPQISVNSFRNDAGEVTTSPLPDDYGIGAPIANTLTIL